MINFGIIDARGVILFLLAIILWIWTLDYSNEFKNIEYGELIFTGIEIRDTNEKICYEHSYEDMMCCVSNNQYLLFKAHEFCEYLLANNFCNPVDNNRNYGSDDSCPYFGPHGIEAGAKYVKCQKKNCLNEYMLYNICYKYKYNDKIFYYCDTKKLLASQANDTMYISPPFKPGNYSSLHIVNNTIYTFESGGSGSGTWGPGSGSNSDPWSPGSGSNSEPWINVNVVDIVNKIHIFKTLSAIFFLCGMALILKKLIPQKIIHRPTDYGSFATL